MESNNWKKLFSRYYMLTHKEGSIHKKALESNYKYIYSAIPRLLKWGTSDDEMYLFFHSLLEIHEKTYID